MHALPAGSALALALALALWVRARRLGARAIGRGPARARARATAKPAGGACPVYLQSPGPIGGAAAGSNLHPRHTLGFAHLPPFTHDLTLILTLALTLTTFLQRITDIDKNGPRLRSVLEVAPEALVHAADADAERRVGGPRSALHGVCVLLKVYTVERQALTYTSP